MTAIEKAAESDDAFRSRVEAEPLPESIGALLDNAVTQYGDDPAWIFVDEDLPAMTWRDLSYLVARLLMPLHQWGSRRERM